MAARGGRGACGSAQVNLLFPLPNASAAECVDTLLSRPDLRIEGIVSFGQASPPGFWHDETEGEFVLLRAGASLLRFAGVARARSLAPVDWLVIAPYGRHGVDG